MRKLWKTIFILLLIIVVAGVVLKVWDYLAGRQRKIGKIKDEAASVGRTPESMPGADEDYFADMDYGVTKKHPDAYGEDGRHSKRRSYQTRTVEKPGVSPGVLFHLIGNTIFLRLADVARDLPS